jgi:ribonuclease E
VFQPPPEDLPPVKAPKAARAAKAPRATAASKAAKAQAAEEAPPAEKARAAEKASAAEPEVAAPEPQQASSEGVDPAAPEDGDTPTRKRRRRGGRGRKKSGESSIDSAGEGGEAAGDAGAAGETPDAPSSDDGDGDAGDEGGSPSSRRRRRRRRKTGDGDAEGRTDDASDTVVRVREHRRAQDEVTSTRGSTRVEAKKQRRRDGRDAGRRRPTIMTESEFLARREAVERVMVVRQRGTRDAPMSQIAVLEDGVLVEHYVDQGTQRSIIGNIYLGRVQNVLPAMEAAFVDIGRGRNAVLYAGEVDWSRHEGKPKRIEEALQSGQSVLVQVSKDPIGHKGARLTSSISLPGRFVVYVPGGSMSGVSRKLSDTERSRLRTILKDVVPDEAEVIIRTAAEGAGEEELRRDVARLRAQWEDIERKVGGNASAPLALYTEPDLTLKIVRDIFNEDFASLVVAGDDAWDTIEPYVAHVAPGLTERLRRWDGEQDVFEDYRVDEQIAKALERKVWLPSGGSLVIDRTEAMTVVDVNTGKFTGGGGNLEETVTRNNLEAAEEIVRQLRLRDVGGIIVIDFIDMVLESNRELVLRRLVECLGRDRTKHQVAEVTSLGLVQMTRKRVGQGLLEAFSTPCETCGGRGRHVSLDPVEPRKSGDSGGKKTEERSPRRRRGKATVAAPEVDPEAAARAREALAKVATATAAAHAAESATETPAAEAPEPTEVAGEPEAPTESPEAVEPDATLV